jgi:hypothetical protein
MYTKSIVILFYTSFFLGVINLNVHFNSIVICALSGAESDNTVYSIPTYN